MGLHLPDGVAAQVEQQNAAKEMRLHLAAGVLGHLAAIDLARAIDTAIAGNGQSNCTPTAGPVEIRPKDVAHAALAYAEALMVAAGVVQPAPKVGPQSKVGGR